jgi:putative ABC transport system ATP-binding protein
VNFTLDHVSKTKWITQASGNRKKIVILDDISTESCGDNIHVILGPSGSGKTTLLRLLNKLESPDKGRILIDNENISAVPARKLRKMIGMVFQVPALFPGTIKSNIQFGPQLVKSNDTLPDVDQILKIVNMEEIDPERDVTSLSVGQQQRISFARALANQPKVLLLDEPTSALDPTAANNLLDLIKEINQTMKIDIIMVTHILHHAQRIGDSICLLANSKIVEYGPAKEFFQQPQTEIGKKFILGEL